MNKDRTSPNSDTSLTQARSGPVLYELVDKDRRVCGTFRDSGQAALVAQQLWPDQEQDEDRTGKGWDVQVAGLRDPELPTD